MHITKTEGTYLMVKIWLIIISASMLHTACAHKDNSVAENSFDLTQEVEHLANIKSNISPAYCDNKLSKKGKPCTVSLTRDDNIVRLSIIMDNETIGADLNSEHFEIDSIVGNKITYHYTNFSTEHNEFLNGKFSFDHLGNIETFHFNKIDQKNNSYVFAKVFKLNEFMISHKANGACELNSKILPRCAVNLSKKSDEIIISIPRQSEQEIVASFNINNFIINHQNDITLFYDPPQNDDPGRQNHRDFKLIFNENGQLRSFSGEFLDKAEFTSIAFAQTEP